MQESEEGDWWLDRPGMGEEGRPPPSGRGAPSSPSGEQGHGSDPRVRPAHPCRGPFSQPRRPGSLRAQETRPTLRPTDPPTDPPRGRNCTPEAGIEEREAPSPGPGFLDPLQSSWGERRPESKDFKRGSESSGTGISWGGSRPGRPWRRCGTGGLPGAPVFKGSRPGCPEPRVNGGCGVRVTRGGASIRGAPHPPAPHPVPESAREVPHAPPPPPGYPSALGQEPGRRAGRETVEGTGGRKGGGLGARTGGRAGGRGDRDPRWGRWKDAAGGEAGGPAGRLPRGRGRREDRETG